MIRTCTNPSALPQYLLVVIVTQDRWPCMVQPGALACHTRCRQTKQQLPMSHIYTMQLDDVCVNITWVELQHSDPKDQFKITNELKNLEATRGTSHFPVPGWYKKVTVRTSHAYWWEQGACTAGMVNSYINALMRPTRWKARLPSSNFQSVS